MNFFAILTVILQKIELIVCRAYFFLASERNVFRQESGRKKEGPEM